MTLRARRPGYAVMQECLRLQSEAPVRTRAQRFWGVDPVAPPAQSWFKGALGERRVAAELDRLGPDFTVLHAVPVGKGSTDIDHLVIGPTGVFSINTKNHSGQRVFVGGSSFIIGGKKTWHIGAAQSEGRTATRLLSAAAGEAILVQPLLVVAADRITFGKKRPPVVVLRPDQVRGWILGLRRAHSDEAVRYLSMVAEERGTWHAAAFVADDTLRLEQRFDRLVRDVEDARVRRRRAALAVVLGAVGIPVAGLVALGGIATALLGS
ncbi:NERD domain-containing protein [Curtobacterium albidum]|uniref:nuclease-related domain-containing protein n=1 Tax=Curtobacterium citreum TaxID=2036 RepID=UPI002025E8F0|nr:nuclease-related domain-containing protein [Curtobacterium albidum]MCL9665407.1 NERD domain-containing protein [Curtobacterium albidum]